MQEITVLPYRLYNLGRTQPYRIGSPFLKALLALIKKEEEEEEKETNTQNDMLINIPCYQDRFLDLSFSPGHSESFYYL